MTGDSDTKVELSDDVSEKFNAMVVNQEHGSSMKDQPAQKSSVEQEGSDDQREQSLADYFSGNTEVMDLFLAFCFLIQRVSTGGVAISELQALHNITKNMADGFGLDTEFLNYIVGSISDNKEIYRVFAKNSSELNTIQKQHPKRLCEIMAEHLPNDYGYSLELKLTGVLLDDLKRVESLLALINKTPINELTSIENNHFLIKPVNPWSVLLADYSLGHKVSKNTVMTSFKHPVSKPSSVYLIKSLVTVRRWLLRRIPEEEKVVKKPVVERLSKFDATMERERFLGITPTFLSMSANRPYRNQKLDSRIVFISDITSSADEDDTNTNEVHEDEAEDIVDTSMISRAKSFFGKFGKGKDKKLEDVKAADREYEMLFVDYAGFLVTHKNLSWFLVDEPYEDTILRQYRQVFFGCAIGEPVDNTIDVSEGITGKWMDAAIGYYMAVNYEILIPEDEL